jgi:hypothetical protein
METQVKKAAKPKEVEAVVDAPAPVAAQELVTLTAFKGFDKDLKCRYFQFEVGKSYAHEGPVVICESGFHSCEDPLDVWSYYDPFDSRFAEVEVSGTLACHDGDSKIASATIIIKAELSLPKFISKAIKWAFDKTKVDSGDYAKNASSGDSATNASSGRSAKNASSGNYAKNASSGDYAKNASSGDYAKNASSGDYAKNASSGDYATNASSGDYTKNEAKGANSVIASAGNDSRAKAAAGTWIAIAEYDSSGKCIGFATGCAGTDGVAADVWLVANNGKLVEEA